MAKYWMSINTIHFLCYWVDLKYWINVINTRTIQYKYCSLARRDRWKNQQTLTLLARMDRFNKMATTSKDPRTTLKLCPVKKTYIVQ